MTAAIYSRIGPHPPADSLRDRSGILVQRPQQMLIPRRRGEANAGTSPVISTPSRGEVTALVTTSAGPCRRANTVPATRRPVQVAVPSRGGRLSDRSLSLRSRPLDPVTCGWPSSRDVAVSEQLPAVSSCTNRTKRINCTSVTGCRAGPRARPLGTNRGIRFGAAVREGLHA